MEKQFGDILFIKGKKIVEWQDMGFDYAGARFEFDLPDGKRYERDSVKHGAFAPSESWVMFDMIDQKVSNEILDSEDDVISKIIELQKKERKQSKTKTPEEKISLNYLPNSTVPDDEEYEEFYEDETCYSDDELDELEERYFW